MTRLVLSRFAQAAVVMWVVLTTAFVLLRIAGDPVALLAPENATQEQKEALRSQLGLDRPVPLQYLYFLSSVAGGHLGFSYYSGQPALRLVLDRFWATFSLITAALAIAFLLGVPMGLLAAVRPNSWLDRGLRLFSAFGISAPTFWVGIMLILLFSVHWNVLPSLGSGTIAHYVMPAFTLALYRIAFFTRLLRSSILEAMGQDYIRTARAKGVSDATVMMRHALRNALVPLVTAAGLEMGHLLAGAVVTESIFAWPGMNRLALDAMHRLDYPVILAFALVVTGFFTTINLVVDILYALVDPRVRFS